MNYNKLWKMLIDRNLMKKDLRKMAGLSSCWNATESIRRGKKAYKGEVAFGNNAFKTGTYYHTDWLPE